MFLSCQSVTFICIIRRRLVSGRSFRVINMYARHHYYAGPDTSGHPIPSPLAHSIICISVLVFSGHVVYISAGRSALRCAYISLCTHSTLKNPSFTPSSFRWQDINHGNVHLSFIQHELSFFSLACIFRYSTSPLASSTENEHITTCVVHGKRAHTYGDCLEHLTFLNNMCAFRFLSNRAVTTRGWSRRARSSGSGRGEAAAGARGTTARTGASGASPSRTAAPWSRSGWSTSAATAAQSTARSTAAGRTAATPWR